MKEEYIIKTSKGKEGEIKETRYRIDADFKPKKIGDICQEFIANYCEANNQGEWLLDTIDKKETDKHGKEMDISSMSIRKAFVLQFFPDILKGKDKAPTWKEQMKARFSKK